VTKKVLAAGGIVVLFFLGYYFGFSGSEDAEVIKRTKIILGTTVEIIFKDSERDSCDKYFNAAFKEFQRIDDLFSSYKTGNPIYEINYSDGDTIEPEREIVDLLKVCDEMNTLTEGAFDVTLGALTNAWKFNTQSPEIPPKDSLEKALSISGWKNLEFAGENRICKKRKVLLNLGAIAKGYAVDKVFELLREKGAKNFLINAGGEIRASGDDWNIGIQDPRNPSSLLYSLILNEEFGVATSGDYENFFEVNGRRFHHILDPLTGFPATGCRSVTIIARKVTTADALATGIFVMGKEKGLKLAESLLDVECLIIDSSGNEFMSNGFEKYLRR
jgi:FAD:protein FMN transferase